jgi:hypothetical protein
VKKSTASAAPAVNPSSAHTAASVQQDLMAEMMKRIVDRGQAGLKLTGTVRKRNNDPPPAQTHMNELQKLLKTKVIKQVSSNDGSSPSGITSSSSGSHHFQFPSQSPAATANSPKDLPVSSHGINVSRTSSQKSPVPPVTKPKPVVRKGISVDDSTSVTQNKSTVENTLQEIAEEKGTAVADIKRLTSRISNQPKTTANSTDLQNDNSSENNNNGDHDHFTSL